MFLFNPTYPNRIIAFTYYMCGMSRACSHWAFLATAATTRFSPVCVNDAIHFSIDKLVLYLKETNLSHQI